MPSKPLVLSMALVVVFLLWFLIWSVTRPDSEKEKVVISISEPSHEYIERMYLSREIDGTYWLLLRSAQRVRRIQIDTSGGFCGCPRIKEPNILIDAPADTLTWFELIDSEQKNLNHYKGDSLIVHLHSIDQLVQINQVPED